MKIHLAISLSHKLHNVLLILLHNIKGPGLHCKPYLVHSLIDVFIDSTPLHLSHLLHSYYLPYTLYYNVHRAFIMKLSWLWWWLNSIAIYLWTSMILVQQSWMIFESMQLSQMNYTQLSMVYSVAVHQR